MPTCPICNTPLETKRQHEGIFYPCKTCDGRAMTIPQIRHVLGDRVAAKLLRLSRLNRQLSQHGCPFCAKPMIAIQTSEPPLQLESCPACAVIWFDLPTYESLPQLTVETTNSITLLSTEIVAMNHLQELKEREEEEERQKAKKKKKLHRLPGIHDKDQSG